MKAPPDAPGRDADGPLLQWRKLEDARFSPLKTACKKLVPLKRTRVLNFAAPAGAAASGCRAMLAHAVHAACPHRTMAADAGTLPAVSIRSRTAAAGADSTGSASLMTEPITAPHALIEALGDHLQSSRSWLFDESGQPPLNHNASVLQAHYTLK